MKNFLYCIITLFIILFTLQPSNKIYSQDTTINRTSIPISSYQQILKKRINDSLEQVIIYKRTRVLGKNSRNQEDQLHILNNSKEIARSKHTVRIVYRNIYINSNSKVIDSIKYTTNIINKTNYDSVNSCEKRNDVACIQEKKQNIFKRFLNIFKKKK